MQPEVQRALEAIQQADGALSSPSQNDPTLRALFHELTHQEQTGQFARQAVAAAHEQLVELSGRFERQERELIEARARIADLEMQQSQPSLHAVDDITGHQRRTAG